MSVFLGFDAPLVAPSLLSADKSRLNEEIAFALDNGAKVLHFDVMDGKFVPNVSFGLDSLSSILSSFPDISLDSHLMVEDPLTLGPLFGRLGSKNVTFHYEACKNKGEILKTIISIRESGAKVGLSIKPATPVKDILPYLPYLDLILLMSVEPGKGGQAFIEGSLERMKELRKAKFENGYHDLILEVDGGINAVTGPKMIAEGADVLVAGSFLFGHQDFKERMESLLRC